MFDTAGTAGCFRLRWPIAPGGTVDRARGALRTSIAALPYGDQGLLVPRSLYQLLGGYRPLPLMEDVDLVGRIGRRRLVTLDGEAWTSAERWRRDGWTRRSLRNLACLSLYLIGVSPRQIARLYG